MLRFASLRSFVLGTALAACSGHAVAPRTPLASQPTAAARQPLGAEYAVMFGDDENRNYIGPQDGPSRIRLVHGSRTIEITYAVLRDGRSSPIKLVMIGADGRPYVIETIPGLDAEGEPRVFSIDPGSTPSSFVLRGVSRHWNRGCARPEHFNCSEYVSTRWPIALRADGSFHIGAPAESRQVEQSPKMRLFAR